MRVFVRHLWAGMQACALSAAGFEQLRQCPGVRRVRCYHHRGDPPSMEMGSKSVRLIGNVGDQMRVDRQRADVAGRMVYPSGAALAT